MYVGSYHAGWSFVVYYICYSVLNLNSIVGFDPSHCHEFFIPKMKCVFLELKRCGCVLCFDHFRYHTCYTCTGCNNNYYSRNAPKCIHTILFLYTYSSWNCLVSVFGVTYYIFLFSRVRVHSHLNNLSFFVAICNHYLNIIWRSK